jgi:hypothetical protein
MTTRRNSKKMEEVDMQQQFDNDSKQFSQFIAIIWFAIKCLLMLLVLYPFLQKVWYKSWFTKLFDLFQEYDLGCKPCNCTIPTPDLKGNIS